LGYYESISKKSAFQNLIFFIEKKLHEFFEYNPREIGSAFHRAGAEIEQKSSVMYGH